MLSLVMFQGDYVRRVMDLGEADALPGWNKSGASWSRDPVLGDSRLPHDLRLFRRRSLTLPEERCLKGN